MKYLLLLSFIFLTGCNVVTTRQQELAAQSLSDIKAAGKFIESSSKDNGIRMAAKAMADHAGNMALAMSINLEELPGPRVSKADWKIDPEGASSQSQENINKDNKNTTDYGMWGLYGAAGLSGLILALKLGSSVFSGTPAGVILGKVGTLFGQAHPTEETLYKKITQALDDYKEVDPNWRTNKLYGLLSESMTTDEKDYIKKQRHVG